MALRGRGVDNFLELWWLVALGGLDIYWVSSTRAEKNNNGWPKQPPTEKVLDINEKLLFDAYCAVL